MLEKWKRYKIPKISGYKYYLETIKQEAEILKIVIASSLGKCEEKDDYDRIIFNISIKAYRLFDEHCRLKLFEKLHEKYGKSFLLSNYYFVVENSEYIKWFCEHSSGNNTITSLKH